jgi:hypothetical protein
MPRLEDDLAASFRQGTYLARRNPDATSEALVFGDAGSVGGVCYALSSMWVVRHISHRAEGPAGRAAYLARESTILAAMAAHRHAMLECRQAQPPDTSPERYRQLALDGHGLAWTPLPLGDISRGGRILKAQLATLHASLIASHRYHFLTFFGDQPALGHAMAAYTEGAAADGLPLLYLFDPNWGEFKVSTRHALDFISRLLAWYDGHREFGQISRLTLGCVSRTP